MTDQQEYEYVKKIATKKYYQALCDYGDIPQRPHDKEHVITTYVEAVLSTWTPKLIKYEKHSLADKIYINMLRQMFLCGKITIDGQVVARWDDRKGCGGLGLVAGAIGLLLGVTLF
jgi:hypothetical protein